MGRLLESLQADSGIGTPANLAKVANLSPPPPKRFADSQLSQRVISKNPQRFADSQLSQGVLDGIRSHLLNLAEAENADGSIIRSLGAEELGECQGCTDDELRGYLRGLGYSARIAAGHAPPGYTQAAECAGCGPVLLWPGSPAKVIACPWCFRRRAGKPIPRPSHPATQTIKQGDCA